MSSTNAATEAAAAAIAAAKAVVLNDGSDSPGSIPPATFFEDVPAVVNEHGAENLIQQLSDLQAKYRFWESKFTKSRNHLEQKIPDVSRALDAVKALEKQSARAAESGGKPIETNFELSEGLYVRAEIPATNTVCLWLGANCMVEYTFEEAISLLSKNLEAASGNLATTETDIAYLRDQINTTDVNMSQYQVQSTRRDIAKGKEGARK